MVFGMSVCTCVCVCTCMYRQCTLLSCAVLWHEVSSAKINLPVEVFGSDFPIKIMKRDQVSPHGARDRPGSTTVKVGFKDMWPSCTLLGLASLTAWMTFLHCFYWEIVSFSFFFFFFRVFSTSSLQRLTTSAVELKRTELIQSVLSYKHVHCFILVLDRLLQQ